MESFTDWLIHLPEYVANAFGWLTSSIDIAGLEISPLAMIGVGLAAFAGIVLVLKIKNLII